MKKTCRKLITPLPLPDPRGFSLIELLVAVTIMTVLLAMAIARYRDFNRSQIVKEAAKTLKSDLVYAQSKALSGSKTENCAYLKGYSVAVTADGGGYSINEVCDDGTPHLNKTVVVPHPGVTLSPASTTILFKVLGLGTDLSSDATIMMADSYSGTVVNIVVTPTGEIR